MSHLYWLDHECLNRIKHLSPKPRGVARSDDRTVLSGIIHVIRNGLRWRDAPAEYRPHKTLYNRFVRWSRLGVLSVVRIFRKERGDFVAWAPVRFLFEVMRRHCRAASGVSGWSFS